MSGGWWISFTLSQLLIARALKIALLVMPISKRSPNWNGVTMPKYARTVIEETRCHRNNVTTSYSRNGKKIKANRGIFSQGLKGNLKVVTSYRKELVTMKASLNIKQNQECQLSWRKCAQGNNKLAQNAIHHCTKGSFLLLFLLFNSGLCTVKVTTLITLRTTKEMWPVSLTLYTVSGHVPLN